MGSSLSAAEGACGTDPAGTVLHRAGGEEPAGGGHPPGSQLPLWGTLLQGRPFPHGAHPGMHTSTYTYSIISIILDFLVLPPVTFTSLFSSCSRLNVIYIWLKEWKVLYFLEDAHTHEYFEKFYLRVHKSIASPSSCLAAVIKIWTHICIKSLLDFFSQGIDAFAPLKTYIYRRWRNTDGTFTYFIYL